MSRTTVSTTIAAPLERVFETLADVRSFERAIPHVVAIDFLSEQRRGAGTRFRETRRVGGSTATTELEITECVANERLRLVADSHGTVWDSVFAVREAPGGTELSVTLEARPYELLARLTAPLALPAVGSALESDLELLKRHCEQGGAADDPASSGW